MLFRSKLKKRAIRLGKDWLSWHQNKQGDWECSASRLTHSCLKMHKSEGMQAFHVASGSQQQVMMKNDSGSVIKSEEWEKEIAQVYTNQL